MPPEDPPAAQAPGARGEHELLPERLDEAAAHEAGDAVGGKGRDRRGHVGSLALDWQTASLHQDAPRMLPRDAAVHRAYPGAWLRAKPMKVV